MSSTTLAQVNERTLGAKFPEVTLSDGTVVQTGTMAYVHNILANTNAVTIIESRPLTSPRSSLMQNIQKYDTLFTKDDSSLETIHEQQQLEASMRAAIPLLAKTGLFRLFKPEEWVNNGGPGRRFVGSVAKAYNL